MNSFVPKPVRDLPHVARECGERRRKRRDCTARIGARWRRIGLSFDGFGRTFVRTSAQQSSCQRFMQPTGEPWAQRPSVERARFTWRGAEIAALREIVPEITGISAERGAENADDAEVAEGVESTDERGAENADDAEVAEDVESTDESADGAESTDEVESTGESAEGAERAPMRVPSLDNSKTDGFSRLMVGEVARGLSLSGGASSEVRRCNCSVVD